MKRLFLKIKRFFFKRITGLYPEDIRKLVCFQKYFELQKRNKLKRSNEYLKEYFNAKQ